MSGLLDIGDLTEEVPLGKNKSLSVSGLTADDLFFLIKTFPEIKALLERRFSQITPQSLMDSTPVALATIIACGTGERENKTAIERARRLPAPTQLRIVNAIFDLTFPEGIGPFVEEMIRLRTAFIAQVSPRTPSQSERAQPGTTSSPQSLASLSMDTLALKHYRPRPANSRRGAPTSKQPAVAS